MSRIVLVRHGETVWHAENRYAGSSDIGLTDFGHKQAQALASWAAQAGLTRLYTSPLSRAQQTAQPVSESLGLAPVIDPRLREIDFGQGEGLTANEMRKRFPEHFAAFAENPVEHWLPGGENPLDCIARGRTALDRIALETDAHDRVLVICHNTLIRLLLCNLLGIEPANYRRVFPALDSVSLTELKFERGIAALLRFNASIVPCAG